MMFRFPRAVLALTLSFALPSEISASANNVGRVQSADDQAAESRNHRRRRRRLEPHDSIHQHLRQLQLEGVDQPEFTIVGSYDAGAFNTATDEGSGGTANGGGGGQTQLMDFPVKLAQNSVTSSTTFSIDGGEAQPVPDLGVSFLVSVDPNSYPLASAMVTDGEGDGRPFGGETSNSNSDENFAFFSIDHTTGNVNGISQLSGSGEAVNIAQLVDSEDGGTGTTTISSADKFVPPDWECSAENLTTDSSQGTSGTTTSSVSGSSSGDFFSGDEFMAVLNMDVKPFPNDSNGDRKLNGIDAVHGPANHAHDHQESHDHFHHHHFRGSSSSDFSNLLSSLKRDIHPPNKSSITNSRKLYATDKFPNLYSYEVELYIEIDHDFLALNQNNMTIAMQYVDALVTAASSIYEKEVDTHLKVAHIALTSLYQDATNTREALTTMKNAYSSTTWHHTSTRTNTPVDLHHALLGRKLGGGLAYTGTLCNPLHGFGLSGNIMGNFVSLDAPTLWDVYGFSHEIGHSFGSRHTHDIKGYDPLVDSCVLSCADAGTFPNPSSATIMSQCYGCSGGFSNIAYTLGGFWDEDDRGDLSNWQNNPILSPGTSTDPKRVPSTMWKHVSTRSVCVEPFGEVPQVMCATDSDCHDGNSCTVDTCNAFTGVCSNAVTEECCGNGICEYGEECAADCGPWIIVTPPPSSSSLYVDEKFMFDLTAEYDSYVTGIIPLLESGTPNVTIYTVAGSLHDATAQDWKQVSFSQPIVNSFSFVNIDIAPVYMKVRVTIFLFDNHQRIAAPTRSLLLRILKAGATQGFYIVSTGRIAFGPNVVDPSMNDGRMRIRASGRRAVSSTPYAFYGAVNYYLEPNDAPTSMPSNQPSASPSSVPSSVPSKPNPTQKMSIPLTLLIQGITIPQDETQRNQVVQVLESSILKTLGASVKLENHQKIDDVVITSITDPLIQHPTRKLQDTTTVDYDVIVEQVCSTPDCNGSDELTSNVVNNVRTAAIESTTVSGYEKESPLLQELNNAATDPGFDLGSDYFKTAQIQHSKESFGEPTIEDAAPNDLGLAHYEGSSVVGGIDSCHASMATTGQETVSCDFKWMDGSTTKALNGATLFASIISGSCESRTDSFAFTPANENASTNGTSTASMLAGITSADRNGDGTSATTMVTKEFCARADLVDDATNMTVLAAMTDVDAAFTYNNEGVFQSSNIQTSAFNAADANASAERSVSITVWKGTCASKTCMLDAGNTCFSGTDQATIGSTLNLCLTTSTYDTDVDIAGIKSVKVIAGDFVSELISSEGTENFVTSASITNGEVTLSSLLIPKYYDSLDGGNGSALTIEGIATLEYKSRRLDENRQLQGSTTANSPFVVSIPLEKKEIPKIAQMGEWNAAGAFHFGGVMLTLVVLANAHAFL